MTARLSGEALVMRQIRDALPLYASWLQLWRNNTGRRGGVSYGLGRGSADWIGVGWGRFIAIECKDDDGVVSADQVAWLASVEHFGGFAAIVRNVGDFHDAIRRFKAETIPLVSKRIEAECVRLCGVNSQFANVKRRRRTG